jgi:hypothetical protein
MHSYLSEHAKRKIISDAQNLKIRILISTSSAGAGVHLPISTFIGWGLDREPSGIVQASGRTARGSGEGNVLWIHNPKIHGRRISKKSAVREILKGNCLRACLNGWFSDSETNVTECAPEPHNCCSNCMEKCIEASSCLRCATSLDQFKYQSGDFVNNKAAVALFSNFLRSLKIPDRSPAESPKYDEQSLAKTIINHFGKTKDVSETITFLEIFSLGDELCKEISDFLKKDLILLFSQSPQNDEDCDYDVLESDHSELDSSQSPSESSDSDEYFDEVSTPNLTT